MMIAPDARLTDGLLDVINIGDLTALRVLTNVHSLYRGTHLDMKQVHSRRAKKVEISAADASQEMHLETDGELPAASPSPTRSSPTPSASASREYKTPQAETRV
jgi:diacylglycerol kinase family enzyme